MAKETYDQRRKRYQTELKILENELTIAESKGGNTPQAIAKNAKDVTDIKKKLEYLQADIADSKILDHLEFEDFINLTEWAEGKDQSIKSEVGYRDPRSPGLEVWAGAPGTEYEGMKITLKENASEDDLFDAFDEYLEQPNRMTFDFSETTQRLIDQKQDIWKMAEDERIAAAAAEEARIAAAKMAEEVRLEERMEDAPGVVKAKVVVKGEDKVVVKGEDNGDGNGDGREDEQQGKYGAYNFETSLDEARNAAKEFWGTEYAEEFLQGLPGEQRIWNLSEQFVPIDWEELSALNDETGKSIVPSNIKNYWYYTVAKDRQDDIQALRTDFQEELDNLKSEGRFTSKLLQAQWLQAGGTEELEYLKLKIEYLDTQIDAVGNLITTSQKYFRPGAGTPSAGDISTLLTKYDSNAIETGIRKTADIVIKQPGDDIYWNKDTGEQFTLSQEEFKALDAKNPGLYSTTPPGTTFGDFAYSKFMWDRSGKGQWVEVTPGDAAAAEEIRTETLGDGTLRYSEKNPAGLNYDQYIAADEGENGGALQAKRIAAAGGGPPLGYAAPLGDAQTLADIEAELEAATVPFKPGEERQLAYQYQSPFTAWSRLGLQGNLLPGGTPTTDLSTFGQQAIADYFSRFVEPGYAAELGSAFAGKAEPGFRTGFEEFARGAPGRFGIGRVSPDQLRAQQQSVIAALQDQTRGADPYRQELLSYLGAQDGQIPVSERSLGVLAAPTLGQISPYYRAAAQKRIEDQLKNYMVMQPERDMVSFFTDQPRMNPNYLNPDTFAQFTNQPLTIGR
jgi:hypothetical protein